jgi:hypothetical protein
VQTYAALLCCFFVFAKAYARYWLFRPAHARPVPVRHNEPLHLLELAAMIALVAAFFLWLNAGKPALALVSVFGLLAYDVLLRFCLLELEVRRLCSSSPNWRRRAARRHVAKRAKAPAFH